MCFDLDSAPPIPPISGAAVSHDDLVLEAADGNRFAAFVAAPEEHARVGVVILPDVRGLYRFYEELALRFAERGYAAIAFDYFGRTAGAEKRDDDFEYMPHVQQTTPRRRAGGRRRVRRASARRGLRDDLHGRVLLRRPELVARGGIGPRSRRARSASTVGPGRATTARRARRSGPPRWPRRSSRSREATTPGSRSRSRRRSTRRSTAAGVEHEVVIYPGAPHSFFDRKYEEFAADSEDAWNRVLAFLERYS